MRFQRKCSKFANSRNPIRMKSIFVFTAQSSSVLMGLESEFRSDRSKLTKYLLNKQKYTKNQLCSQYGTNEKQIFS